MFLKLGNLCIQERRIGCSFCKQSSKFDQLTWGLEIYGHCYTNSRSSWGWAFQLEVEILSSKKLEVLSVNLKFRFAMHNSVVFTIFTYFHVMHCLNSGFLRKSSLHLCGPIVLSFMLDYSKVFLVTPIGDPYRSVLLWVLSMHRFQLGLKMWHPNISICQSSGLLLGCNLCVPQILAALSCEMKTSSAWILTTFAPSACKFCITSNTPLSMFLKY